MISARHTSAIPVPTRMMLCNGSTSLAHLSRGLNFDNMTFGISVRLQSTKGAAERENDIVATGVLSSSSADSGLRSNAIHFEVSPHHWQMVRDENVQNRALCHDRLTKAPIVITSDERMTWWSSWLNLAQTSKKTVEPL